MLLIFADLLDFWVPRITDPIVCKSCAPHKVAKSQIPAAQCEKLQAGPFGAVAPGTA